MSEQNENAIFNGKDYVMTQISLLTLGKQIQGLNLEGFIKTLSNIEKVSAALEPSLLERAKQNLAAVKTLAEKFLEVQKSMDELASVVQSTNMAYMVKKEEQPIVATGGEITMVHDKAGGTGGMVEP